MMNLQLRSGRPEDAVRSGEICYTAFATISGAHAFPADFPSPEVAAGLMSQLLARKNIYSVVAELDGRVVGSNFLWEDGLVAGVGPITIDPSVQNKRVGRALMEQVLERARSRKVASVRLVQAAYHNRSLSLYTRLGFDAQEPLSVLQGPALNEEFSGYRVRPATTADIERCNQLYLRLHGYERTGELSEAVSQGTATVVEHGGAITGYATLVGFFGHAAAENNAGLKALIGAASNFPGPGFLLPTRNSELLRWCLARGLRIVQPMTLMSIGLYQEPKGAFLPSVLY